MSTSPEESSAKISTKSVDVNEAEEEKNIVGEKTVMSVHVERVRSVIHRFKEIIVELSSLVTADARAYKLEDLQTISSQMCVALNELIHMVEYTDEVFTADDFLIISHQMQKQNDVRNKVLTIVLRGHRVLLESISKCIAADTPFSEKACVAIEAAVLSLETVVPRASVHVPSFCESMFGSK
mmetsp:Transcript_5696/g.9607  ORF Transcript_5696/g.9607 Transcript_5696/m.9607 type:complete len:182 (-) Transcript_5696:80-625(-)|eukprot:CAMPEP_0184997432 /NCGR_PEP_ID=MMETSP1098-20130426/59500_1 /TAXON_ID=89044 /ORGANISM="Spumella elongata, Strain CCAP 955/1" /LENGTH=181 /DNA_ID=CAMNT_0027524063 /DNA_START=113 /DNA_END=658 /DNA_ORIENTATION=+